MLLEVWAVIDNCRNCHIPHCKNLVILSCLFWEGVLELALELHIVGLLIVRHLR